MRLRWRLLGLYVLVFLTALLVLYLWTETGLRKSYLGVVEEQLRRQVRTLSPLLDPGDPDLDEKIDQAAGSSGNRITVMDAAGKVVGDSALSGARLEGVDNHLNRAEVQLALREGEGSSIRYSTSIDQQLLYVAHRLPDGRGFLRVATSLQGTESRLRDVRWALGWRALLLGAVGCLLCIWVSGRWVGSLGVLEAAARRLAQGDYTGPFEVSPGDDLGGLGASLQRVAGQLRGSRAQLEMERSYLDAVLASLNEGILVVGEDGRIRYANPAFIRIFDLSDGPVGKLPLEVARQPEIQEAVASALSQRVAVSGEFRIDGKTLEMHLSPIRPRTEKGAVVAIFHDISELRRLEKVRQDFVSNVSHELSTPLTSIQGYSETLEQEAEGMSEIQRAFVEKIARNSAHLAEIIQALLDLSRIEQGSLSPGRERIAVSDLREELERSWREPVETKGLKWHFESDAVTTFSASRALLFRALHNLMDNAVGYTERGEVGVRLTQEEDSIRVDVRDTGAGIPEAEQARVFERFYRASGSRHAGQGSGVGLSIVKHIVALHGGRIWLRSQLGEGTQVSFTLPQNSVKTAEEGA